MLGGHLWDFRMPAEYRIDPSHNLVISFCVGPLTADDMLGHQRRLSTDPAFQPTMHQILDFCAVTELRVTAADIRMLAQATLFSDASRRAIVVGGRDDVFGLSRMYEILRDRGPERIEVFRTYPEALVWLDLPADYPRAVGPMG